MDFEDLIIQEFGSNDSVLCMTASLERVAKSLELAKEMREAGNKMFTKCLHNDKMHERIWDCYLSSIALSPPESESLAISYGNLSALLFNLKNYKDCINNIDKALTITESTSLIIKLLCRKSKCLSLLELPQTADEYLEKANWWLKRIHSNDDNKETLEQLVNKTKIALNRNREKIQKSKHTTAKKSKEKVVDVFDAEDPESNHLQILAQVEEKGIFKSVTMSKSNKYGRHLVASRNIRPGEIIIVAKPYVAVPNFMRNQNFCNNCLKAVWSAIPCKNCACCIYCSQECHDEALEKYHDIECSALQFIVTGNHWLDSYIQISFRAVIMAVKEFGTIENLRKAINAMDSCEDDNGGFSEGGKFRNNSFISLFGFKNNFVEYETLSQVASLSCRAVIGLVKFTNFFGNSKLETVEDLTKNEDTVFIATLLLRVARIAYNNAVKVPEPCTHDVEKNPCTSYFPCCERGFSLNPVNQYIAHSCNPNVKSIKTEGHKDMWYALQPIKKGFPILECYGPMFFQSKLVDRQEATARALNRKCRCTACVNNWPAVLVPENIAMNQNEIFKIVLDSREFTGEKVHFLNLVGAHDLAHQLVIDELKKIIEASYDYFGQPSAEVCAAITLLCQAFDQLYGNQLDIPISCKKLERLKVRSL